MPTSISDRLKALGVEVGAQEIKPAPKPQADILDQVLNGHVLSTPLGETFIAEARFPIGTPHGKLALRLTAPLNRLAEWANDSRIKDISPQSLAFLDIETTGLSGGTGTYPFLIGVGRFDDDAFHLLQIFLRDPSEESAQLAAFEAFLSPCQAIVTYNGKAFDAPLLASRFITHGLRTPFLDMAHIDLLHLSRRLWRERLPSRTLSNLEVQILGALRSEEDIPGWMIPALYFEYLRDGDARPLKNIFYHNRMDVLSLVALLDHEACLLSNPLQFGGQYGVDLIALAKLFEDLGDLETATSLYIHGLEHEDAKEDRVPRQALLQALQRLALIHKRQHNLEAAIQLWEQAALHEHIDAFVELAKAYEHHLNDYTQAISWTESAIALLGNSTSFVEQNHSMNIFQKRQWMFELQHRLERLLRKAHKA